MMNRRNFLASLSLLPAALAVAAENSMPANKNVKWALSSALWNYRAHCAVHQHSGRDEGYEALSGVRVTSFPQILTRYSLTQAQMLAEVTKRGLHVVTISWNFPSGVLEEDPANRQKAVDSAREAMKVLADFGANHLVVFSPNRDRPGADSPAAFEGLCTCCNQIGELAGTMGFTAGLHNHMGQMVQTREEIDRFMAKTDAKLFGLSPDTAHLNLAGCNVVGTVERYKDRIRFLDYKDSKWTTPTSDWVQPNGKALAKDSSQAKFFDSIYDLGDGEVDFPGCHRVLKSVKYRGWICVDLDTARTSPHADFERCGDYIVKKLQPIYL